MERYAEYKDSGIGWIGKMPSGWGLWQTKYLFYIIKDIAGEEGRQVLSVTQKGVMPKDISSGEGQLAQDYSNYQVVQVNDYVMNHMDLLTGWVDCSKFAGVTSPDYRVFRSMNPQNSLKYYLYCFQHCYSARIYYSMGQGVSTLGRWRLQREPFMNAPLPLPSLIEQQAIADYLDEKTAQIDALIVDTEKSIQLLTEYRKSVISEAVTKGLDPNVPMKDSCIDWIGDIPTHWSIMQLRYLGSARNGLTYNPDDIVDDGEGTLVLRSSNVQNGKLTFHDNVYVNMPIREDFRVNKGDLLICSRNGSPELIGKNALINEAAAGSAFGAFMCIFRGVYNDYLYYVLRSNIFSYYLGTFLTSTINQLTSRNLNSIAIPFPKTRQERCAIIVHLEKMCEEIDAAIEIKQMLIIKLEKYKTSLISECVTGKIKVPGVDEA